MSTSSDFSYQKPVRFMDKPSFSQKCSMLSQYLKEKGSFGDLSLGMTCSTEPAPGTPELSLLLPTATAATTMNLFPQQSGFVSPVSKEDVQKMADSRVIKPATVEPQSAQMTIFYGGKVIVFDDLPADKAKEVMLLASKGSLLKPTPFASNPVKNPSDAGNLNPPTPNVIPNFNTNLVQENAQRPPQAVVCDLPIARRASLHRFLEKRKDRITAKPYQSNSPVGSSPSQKAAESKAWLGLAGQSPQHFQC